MTQTMNKDLPQNSLKKHQKYQNLLIRAEDEQEPTVKQPQKTKKILGDEDLPVKIPSFAAASCTYILAKGIRKSKQCGFSASDQTGKFCNYHKKI